MNALESTFDKVHLKGNLTSNIETQTYEDKFTLLLPLLPMELKSQR
jgi:hypothetical protein